MSKERRTPDVIEFADWASGTQGEPDFRVLERHVTAMVEVGMLFLNTADSIDVVAEKRYYANSYSTEAIFISYLR